MIKINDTIEFELGIELQLQNEDFKAWFAENCQPNITFSDGKNETVQTCVTFDEFGRPSTWAFEKLTVKAVYFTENENYNFNKFVCYGTI